MVYHFQHWSWVAINLLCKKFASITPNMAYVSDVPIPGRTVKSCQRGLVNLREPGRWGGTTEIGPGYDYRAKDVVNGTGWDYGRPWNKGSREDWEPRVYEGSANTFSDGGHSWLTMGEYRSKALSVVKPHEELEPIESDHRLRRLMENPNPFDTQYDFRYEELMFRKLTGVSYIWLCPNDWGTPAEMWVIPSHWVWPRTGGGKYVSPDFPHADELIQYYEIRPWGGMGSAGMLRFPPNEVMMTLYKSPINKIDGYSPLFAMARWQDLEESNSQARWSQMVNMARPEMALRLGPGYEDPDDDRIARIEAKFLAKLQGEINTGKPFVLPSGAELQLLSFTPEQMLYGGTEEQVRDMLLSGHNVPPAAVGLVKDQTYGSVLATLSALCSFGLNPELVQEGQALTKHLASRFDEEAPAYSSGFSMVRSPSGPVEIKCIDNSSEIEDPYLAERWRETKRLIEKRVTQYVTSGHGGHASSKKIRIWYDDCVPADPQQVNNDISADQASYSITPNEVRALRGRKPYKLGGNNPIVTGPGGPMPLPLNEEEDVGSLADVISQLSQADAKNDPEPEQSEFADNPDEALQQSPLVGTKPVGAPGTKPGNLPGGKKPEKPEGRAGEDVKPPKKPPENTMGKPKKPKPSNEVGQPDTGAANGSANGAPKPKTPKPKLGSRLSSSPPKHPNGPPKKSMYSDDIKEAKRRYQQSLDKLRTGGGQSHLNDDAAYWGTLSGMGHNDIIRDMTGAGVSPDDAATAVLHTRAQPLRQRQPSRLESDKDWSPTDVMGSCECGHDRDSHEGGVTHCQLCNCDDYRVVHDGVADTEYRTEVTDAEINTDVEKGEAARKLLEGGGPLDDDFDDDDEDGDEEGMEKGMGDTVQSAGRWLADKWQFLEDRYGRKQALAMAVSIAATLPIPGNIAAVIAVAEGIRGMSGYFQRELGVAVAKGE